MDTSGQPDDFAPPPLAFPVVASSPPNNSPPSMSVSRSGDIKSKATNIPQDDDESTDLGSRSATKGPTRPPYDSADERKPAGEAASDGRRSDVAAAGATLPHASRPDTCADADHDTARSADNNQILLPAISAAVSKTHSAIALRGASSELDIKLDIQSPLGQVSPPSSVCCARFSPVISSPTAWRPYGQHRSRSCARHKPQSRLVDEPHGTKLATASRDHSPPVTECTYTNVTRRCRYSVWAFQSSRTGRNGSITLPG